MMEVAAAAPSLEQSVASAESALVEVRAELERTRSELERLTRLQHHHLGPLYDRLDLLDALIAEVNGAVSSGGVVADFDPLTDPLPEPAVELPLIDPQYASSLRFLDPGQADAEAAGPVDAASAVRRVFRDLARRAHPDLAQDPVEKERRTAFIARVNDAYRRGDLYELQRLAEEWAVIGAAGPEPGSAQRELWLRRRLIWLRARIAEARVERDTLLSSPIGQVLVEFGAARAVDTLCGQLWQQIRVKERELDAARDAAAGFARPQPGREPVTSPAVVEPASGPADAPGSAFSLGPESGLEFATADGAPADFAAQDSPAPAPAQPWRSTGLQW